ncbi:MAG TPA: hypothetical protein DE179_07740 [Oceanospirillaceae bacterium]|nr:hypothetical protein [Oceanospirillaceae bacterium]
MKTMQQLFIAASLAAISSLSFSESLPLGDDLYALQENIITQGSNDDIFAVANSININHAVAGSAHVIGRHLIINAPIAHNLYMAGDNITLQEPVSQDVLALGSNIQLNSHIAGELRALGEAITIYGNVAGDALIGGDNVHLEGVIGGDLNIGAKHLSFGDQARVAGTITVYEDGNQTLTIPAHVASANDIVRVAMPLEDMHDYRENYDGYAEHSGWQDWLSTSLVLALLAFAAALIARQYMTKTALKAQENKKLTLLQGTLSLAIVIGCIPLFAITIIGMPISAILAILAVLLVLAGWVMGAFTIGQMAWQRLRGNLPNTTLSLAMTSLLGAALVTLLAAIPFLGWLIGLAVVLLGIGAISPWQTRRYS